MNGRRVRFLLRTFRPVFQIDLAPWFHLTLSTKTEGPHPFLASPIPTLKPLVAMLRCSMCLRIEGHQTMQSQVPRRQEEVGKQRRKWEKTTILIHFRCSWLVHVFHTVYVITHTVYQICVYIQYYYTSNISWTLLWRHDTTHQKLFLQSGNGVGCVHSKHLLKRCLVVTAPINFPQQIKPPQKPLVRNIFL